MIHLFRKRRLLMSAKSVIIITAFLSALLLVAVACIVSWTEGNEMGFIDRIRAAFSKQSKSASPTDDETSSRGKCNKNSGATTDNSPVPQDLLEEIRALAVSRVKEGFVSEEEIVECVTGIVEDEHGRSGLMPHVAKITAGLLQEHREVQATWITPTDCDKLDNAFARLTEQGIIVRQNFSCCQNCGFAEIGDEIEEEQKVREVRGFTFYHMQDTESARETGNLWLCYGALTGDKEDSVAIGHAIVKALQEAGLTVVWDGSLKQRICVTHLDWRRRRN